MSKKKGMSIEEKVLKVEEFFKERQEPFTLKDLESMIPKAKGVIYQSVLECVNLLVAEGRVQSEKIGVFQLFWHFSATAANKLRVTQQDAARGVARMEARNADMRAAVAAKESAAASVSDDDAALRESLLYEIAALSAEKNQLEHKIANVSDCDPIVFHELRVAAHVCRDCANRWTDNLFTLEALAVKRMGMTRAEFRRRHAIADDLDFIETAIPT
jgi:hypothetical protein